MEKVVDHDGRIVERAFDGIIITDIQQLFFLTELPHLRIQH